MTIVVMLRSTDDIVSARCLRRSDSSEVSKILAVFPRASTPGTVPSAARSATRRINRFTMNRTTRAMTTIEAIWAGLASSQSDDSARPLLPVRS